MSPSTFLRHPSASSFLDRARGFLVAAEAENILLLGIAEDLSRREISAAATQSPTAPNLFTVESDSAVVMAALQTPPRKLLVSRGPEPAIETLVDGLTKERLTLPGVNGPVETARTFISGSHWGP